MEGSGLQKSADVGQMNISRYHNLQRKLQAFEIDTLLSTLFLTNIAKV